MSRWVLHTLWHARGAALASAFGVALALLLALYLDAMFRGEADQVVAFIEHAPGDIWVLQDGIENLHMSRSRISDQDLADLQRAVPDARVTPVVYRDTLVGPKGLQRLAYAVGLPPGSALGAWELAAGRAEPGVGEAVVPYALARMLGLGFGDEMRIGPRRLRIVGLSRGTFSMANPLIYLNESEAREMLKIRDGASFALVDAPAGRAAAVASTIERELGDEVEVLPRERLIRSDWRLALEMGGELIRLMEFVGLIVSALVVSFSSFTFIARRQGELAVARALGATRAAILGAAILMSLCLALAGVALAGVLVLISAPLLGHYVPEVAVHFWLPTFVQLSAAVMLVAVVAALVPGQRVARVDPTLVFQA